MGYPDLGGRALFAMPSATKKRPLLELEPGEGKALEMSETSKKEVREGSEEQEGKYQKTTSRKRSAKGARNTKAPMDGESCSCGAKKGAKCACDGGCGYSKKMDSALTPQEYLAACDLRIQNKPRSYIRSRLDSQARLDLKCGNDAIREGQKCTKGVATKAKTSRPSIRAGAGKGAKYGALIGGGLGLIRGAVGGALTEPENYGGAGARARNALMGAAGGTLFGAAGGALQGTILGGTINAARKISSSSRTRKTDSIWAAGFEP